jgi:hypothetical protein
MQSLLDDSEMQTLILALRSQIVILEKQKPQILLETWFFECFKITNCDLREKEASNFDGNAVMESSKITNCDLREKEASNLAGNAVFQDL